MHSIKYLIICGTVLSQYFDPTSSSFLIISSGMLHDSRKDQRSGKEGQCEVRRILSTGIEAHPECFRGDAVVGGAAGVAHYVDLVGYN